MDEILFGGELGCASLVASVLNQGHGLFRWGQLLRLFDYPPLRWLVYLNRWRVDRVLCPLIAERRRRRRGDVLSFLIESGMSDREVRDEALTLLLAGNETTANALAWAVHLWAAHPGPWTAEQVMLESLRLYPANWGLGRRVREPVRLGGQLLPAGVTVLASQWRLHRNPRWFPETLRFNPARWQGLELPRHVYFPFGVGPRVCLGEHLARLEMKLVLESLAPWRLEPAGGPVRPEPGVTLRPTPSPRVRLRA